VKGISDIIEIILVLMIVIAMVALSYTWFSGLFGDIMRTVAAAITRSATVMSIQFKVEAARFNITSGRVDAVIRNTGSQSFNASAEKLAAYIEETNSAIDEVDISSPYILTGGGLVRMVISNNTESCNKNLRLTIETGLSDSRSINC